MELLIGFNGTLIDCFDIYFKQKIEYIDIFIAKNNQIFLYVRISHTKKQIFKKSGNFNLPKLPAIVVINIILLGRALPENGRPYF